MSPTRRYARKQAKAIKRRRLNAKERQERQQRQSQRDIEALHQALQEVGLLDDLVAEIAGRLLGNHETGLQPRIGGRGNRFGFVRLREAHRHEPRELGVSLELYA